MKGFYKKNSELYFRRKKRYYLYVVEVIMLSLVSKNPSQILEKHHIFKSTHPSPLSANRGGWFGVKMFSKSIKN